MEEVELARGERLPEPERCTYVVRLVDGRGELLYDAAGVPLLQRCRAKRQRLSDHSLDLVCTIHARENQIRAEELALVKGRVGQLLEVLDQEALHPLDGLLDVVRRSGRMVRLFEQLVSELDTTPSQKVEYFVTAEGVPQDVVIPGGLWGPDKDGEQAPHIYLSLYRQWLDMHAKHVKMCSDAGLDERLVRNAEMTSAALFTALDRALQDANLSSDQMRSLKQSLGRELRALETATSRVLDVPA